jgi:hypothetical protein
MYVHKENQEKPAKVLVSKTFCTYVPGNEATIAAAVAGDASERILHIALQTKPS